MQNESESPMVSVCCAAYNQEEYISKTIESFLKQKTDFPFEILIHDDASTDKTADIIKKYVDEYPGKITAILQNENQYSKGITISPTFVWPRANGKYIATCEGDDYWTDPYKLQKQVEFLENHIKCGATHTGFYRIYRDPTKGETACEKDVRENFVDYPNPFFGRLTGDYFIKTLTLVAQKDLLLQAAKKHSSQISSCSAGDLPIELTLENLTEVKYFAEPTAVYRDRKGSASNPESKKESLMFSKSLNKTRVYFAEEYDVPSKIKRQVYRKYFRVFINEAYHLDKPSKAEGSIQRMAKKKVLPSFKDSLKLILTFLRLSSFSRLIKTNLEQALKAGRDYFEFL